MSEDATDLILVDHELAENCRQQGEVLLTRLLAPLLVRKGCARAHVVLQSNAETRVGSQVLGLSSLTLDWQFRKAIGDDWRGRAACILVNDTTLAKMYPSDQMGFRFHFWAICVHEAVHVIEDGIPRNIPRNERLAVITDAVMRTGDKKRPTEIGLAPFHGHEDNFIRLALHAAHRARRAGYMVDDEQVCDSRMYQLSEMRVYSDALGDEPYQFARVPLQNLYAVPPPEKFTELFAADVERWKRRSAIQSPSEQTEERSKVMVVLKTETAQSLDALADQLDAERRDKVAAADKRYRRVVDRLADNEANIPTGELREVIDGAGKTPQNLKDDVKLKLRRREWLAAIVKQKENTLRRQAIICRGGEIQEEIKRITDPLLAENRRLAAELERFNQDDIFASTAEDELRRTAPSELKEELRFIDAESKKVAAQADRIKNEMDDLANAVVGLRRQQHEESSDFTKSEIEANIRNLERRVKEFHAEWKLLQTRLDELRSAEAKLLADALQP